MTLVQGDLRLDNILFTDKNNRAILLDWQTATGLLLMMLLTVFLLVSLIQTIEPAQKKN